MGTSMITRRELLVTGSMFVTFGSGKKLQASSFPVPKWRPKFHPPLKEIIGRFQYYRNNAQDFVIFKNGTCVPVENGTPASDAIVAAKLVLEKIVNFHPDFQTLPMDDGNFLVTYNQTAFNVILRRNAQSHWAQIERHHLEGLLKDEVIISPAGHNIFDDMGKIGLLGRSYMFMDAINPRAARVIRKV